MHQSFILAEWSRLTHIERQPFEEAAADERVSFKNIYRYIAISQAKCIIHNIMFFIGTGKIQESTEEVES